MSCATPGGTNGKLPGVARIVFSPIGRLHFRGGDSGRIDMNAFRGGTA